MSAISLKSITGITSITTPAGVDNQLTLHTNDTTQRVKVTQSGIEVVGVATFQDIDVDGHTNLDNVNIAGVTTTQAFQATTGTFTGDVDIASTLCHSGDTDTKITFATNTIKFDTDTEERLRITSGGQLVIGHTASVPTDTSTNHFRLQVSGTSFSTSGVSQQRYQSSASGASLLLAHSRNATQGNHTILQVDDEYGKIRFYGSDGTDFEGFGAAIVAKVETGIAENSTPGRLEFHTTASGAQDGTERLRITSTGLIYVNRDGVGGRIDATAGDASIKFSDGNGRQTFKIATMASGQSAAHEFDANGDLNLNTSTNQYGYRLNIQDSAIIYAQTASSGGLEAKWHLDNSAELMEFGTVTTDNLALVTNNVPRLRITSGGDIQVDNGNVHIDDNGEFAIFEQDTSLAMTNSSKISMDFDSNVARIRSSHNGSGGNAVSRPLAFFIGSSEKLRIDSDGQVQIGSGTIHGGGHLTIRGGGVNTYATLDYQYVGTPSNNSTTLAQLRFTANTTGAAVVQGAKIQAVSDAAWAGTGDAPTRLEFHTAPDGSASMENRMTITSTGQLSLKSNDGLYIRPQTDSNDAKITFSTNNNNGNTQIGHIKYNHQDNAIVQDYGEGIIMGGTETNGFVLRVDGGINIKDSGTFGGAAGKITLGTDKDMRIYHTGGDGYIDGTGTGGFRLRYNDIIVSNFNSTGTRRFMVNKDQGMEVYATTNGGEVVGGVGQGISIKMSDHNGASPTQIGSITYKHSDNSIINDSINECFQVHGTETRLGFAVSGRMYVLSDKFVMKPSGTSSSDWDDIPNNAGTTQGVYMRCDSGQSTAGNSGIMCNNQYEPFIANRTGADGTVIRIRHQANTEGEIKVNGSSVTYGNFMGSHKAQFVDHSKPDILIGTVMEAVDQLATWKYASFSVGVGTDATTKYIPYYGSKNDGETDTITFESNTYNAIIKNHRDPMPEITKHVCVKVSDTVGSKAVFGVFNCWQEENVVERESSNTEYSWNDLDVASIGNYFIRMQSGQTPEVGDYVESAGDGTAKVQSDDILRSKTIAKITSLTKQKTYDDGSFLVTCTLHCG